MRKNAQALATFLGLPQYVFPMIGLCVGYPAEDPGTKPRLPPHAVLSMDTYRPASRETLVAYDAAYADYLRHRPWNSRVGNWMQLAADFYRHPFHYQGVAEALKAQGFAGVTVS